MFDIKEALKNLPDRPGVYIMHRGDTVLYVGKAVNLKNRVSQYFRPGADGRINAQRMVEKVDWFEYIVTDNEMEAFILENNLIKEHRPPYNILLKDDKRYPYIKVTVQEPFPRILKTRTVARDRNLYFGPYTNGLQLNETLALMQELWPLRDCERVLPRDIGKERPCLNYHIGKCAGPCTGCVTQEEYRKYVDEAIQLLEGRDSHVTARLKAEMKEAAAALDFEKAAKLRDRLAGIAQLSQSQKLEDADPDEERDVIALARTEELTLVQAFFIRGGKLIGREHFMMDAAEGLSDSAVMNAFLRQFYGGTALVPREILVECLPDEPELIREFLARHRGGALSLAEPVRGKKAKLMALAHQNAELTLGQFGQKLASEEKRTRGASEALGALLGFGEGELHRIEAYDISNTFGYFSVGSMVVFEDGQPKKSDYRKFRIETVAGANDFASLAEVLRRRFTHGIEEMKELVRAGEDPAEGSFTRLPELLLMDGGAGQIAYAESVLAELGLPLPVAGMVKDDRHRTRGLIFRGEELPLDPTSDLFRLITRVQDEAHRFAITYHRSLRREAQLSSLLEEIPGIGPAKRKILTETFGSVNRIRALSAEELAAAPGISARDAEEIARFFAAAQEEKER